MDLRSGAAVVPLIDMAAAVLTPPLPPGHAIDLPGRGRTFARYAAGPAGAPTVLLLHGWTASADLNWFRCYQPLSRHFNVVAIDHRGHGRGIRSRRPFRLEDCADDAAALAGELGIDRLIAVGYSMGGPIAQLLWRRHRDLVQGLVLCATARNFGRGATERAAFTAMLGLSNVARVAPPSVRREVASRVFQRRLAQTPLGGWATQELARNDMATILQAGWSIGRFSSHEWIGEVDVPTSVVLTLQDQAVSPHRQRRLAESIPGARVYPVQGDHGVCVIGAQRFVPVLIQATTDVARAHRRASAASTS